MIKLRNSPRKKIKRERDRQRMGENSKLETSRSPGIIAIPGRMQRHQKGKSQQLTFPEWEEHGFPD